MWPPTDLTRAAIFMCLGMIKMMGASSPPLNNLARGGVAQMSSEYSFHFPAENLNDGNLSTMAHTLLDEAYSWVEIDTGSDQMISTILITNRVAGSSDRLQYANLSVDGVVCAQYNKVALDMVNVVMQCDPPVTGRVVRLTKKNPTEEYRKGLNLLEIEIYGDKGQLYMVSASVGSSKVFEKVVEELPISSSPNGHYPYMLTGAKSVPKCAITCYYKTNNITGFLWFEETQMCQCRRVA